MVRRWLKSTVSSHPVPALRHHSKCHEMPRVRFPVFASGVVAVAVTVAATPVAQSQLRHIGIDLTPLAEADAAHAGATHRIALEARIEPGFHVNSNKPLDEFLIPTDLTLDPPAGITLEGLAWPDPVMLNQVGANEPLAVFEEEFVIGVRLALAPDVAPGEHVVPGTLRYQACDETMCYAPVSVPVVFQLAVVPETQLLKTLHLALFDGLTFTAAGTRDAGGRDPDKRPVLSTWDDANVIPQLDGFAVLGTTGGYLNAGQFLEFVERAESGQTEPGWFEGRGPLAILVLILIGGLALNLTPCVLPVIPINLAIIGAGTQAGSRRRGFALGSAYGLAMALVYGVLGLGVILTAGTFGTINASPWFNLSIALLFVVLALALFDVLTIDFSRFQSKVPFSSSGGGSFLVAFGMGGVSALLAGACVAPVVIQVIVFSSNLYATGTAVALALPFILGLGMAIPWPIAGAGLTLMPKPGPWMIRVKQAFGLFILGSAVYYGYLSYGLFSQRWVNPDLVADSVQELIEAGWHPTLSQGLQAAQDEDMLVLVDIWATWCKNCLTMDKTTLKEPDVQTALDGYVKIKFQAEDLSSSPASEVMERFEAIGLPTYAILRPSKMAAPAVVSEAR